MLESSVEKRLFNYVHKLGGRAIKLQRTGRRGDVDRILVLPHGQIVWAELKAPGKKPRPEQLRVHTWLRLKGHRVMVVDGTNLPSAFAFLRGLATMGAAVRSVR